MRVEGSDTAALLRPAPAEASKVAAGPSFEDRLGDLLRAADGDQKAAETEAKKIADGTGDGLDAMLALSKADQSLRFVAELRNRGLEAFQEIMRLQV